LYKIKTDCYYYRVNPNYIHDLTPKLQALCAQFTELKEEAKRVNSLSME
jgi:hypothetical protein